MKNQAQTGDEFSAAANPRQHRKTRRARAPRPALPTTPLAPSPVLRAWPIIELGSEIYAAETLIEKLAEKLMEQYAKSPTTETVRLAGSLAEIVAESRSRLHTALYRTFHFYLGGKRA